MTTRATKDTELFRGGRWTEEVRYTDQLTIHDNQNVRLGWGLEKGREAYMSRVEKSSLVVVDYGPVDHSGWDLKSLKTKTCQVRGVLSLPEQFVIYSCSVNVHEGRQKSNSWV